MSMRGENPRPTTDLIFRKLFGSEENKDLLISLINSVVEPNLHLTDVVIKNPFLLADYEEGKESIVDIKAVDQDSIWYDIEMQLHVHAFYGKRAIYYAAKTFTEQLGKGEDYSALNTTIGIHFLGFDFFHDARIVRHFTFRDSDTNEFSESLKSLQLYFVELGKFQKALTEVATPLERWVAFLTTGAELDHDDLPSALAIEPAIDKAVGELSRMGGDPKFREIYERQEMARMVDAATLQLVRDEATRQGMQQGIEQGVQQGKHLGQLHLLNRQLASNFGAVPQVIAERLETLTSDQLDDLGEALFKLGSYEGIADWLSRR